VTSGGGGGGGAAAEAGGAAEEKKEEKEEEAEESDEVGILICCITFASISIPVACTAHPISAVLVCASMLLVDSQPLRRLHKPCASCLDPGVCQDVLI